MLNEGTITNNLETEIRSVIIRQIRALGPTTSDRLEAAVFKAITGHARDEVDWDVEDNQAGYYLWLKTFDNYVEQLIEDGFIRIEGDERSRAKTLVPAETDPPMGCAQNSPPTISGE